MRLLLWTLFSHYRRSPLQLLFLAVGVILAVSLFVGVQAINELARQSYRQGEQLLGQQPSHFIEPASVSATVEQDFFVALRLAGVKSAAPLMRGRLELADGSWIRLIGVDPLSWPGEGYDQDSDDTGNQLREFMLPPYQVRVAPSWARANGWQEGQRLQLADGRQLAAINVTRASLEQYAMVDIGYGQVLLGKPDQLNAIALFNPDPVQLRWVEDHLPADLLIRATSDQLALEQLTGSFHLNLTALGLLAFVVGLFLIYSAVNYTLDQRQLLVCRLRVMGVGANRLRLALWIELTLLVTLFAIPGIGAGLFLAKHLAPGVTQTLAELYSVILSSADAGSRRLVVTTLALTLLGCWLACAWPLLRLSRTSPLWVEHRTASGLDPVRREWILLLFAAVLLLLALGVTKLATSLTAAFVVIALVLLAAALALPWSLRLMLNAIGRCLPDRWPTTNWLVADGQSNLGLTAVVMMALLVALASNSGINTMIGSFRDAVTNWIELRLESDIYVRGEGLLLLRDGQSTLRFPNLSVINRYQRDLYLPERGRRSVTSFNVDAQGREALPMRKVAALGWERFQRGEGVMINERLYLLGGVQLEQLVELPGSNHTQILPVVGVFYDYGNLFDQLIVSEKLFKTLWPGTPPAGLGLITARVEDPLAVERWLLETLQLKPADVGNRAEIRQLVLAVFDRTFVITQSLNVLTLAVAGIGLFCSLAMLERNRSRHLALLCCLGVGRRQLIALSIAQWILLGVLVSLLAIPFGILLTWLLIDLVNVRAFGWSMPLTIHWPMLLQLPLLGASTALLAGLVPAGRLLRLPVSRLVREA